MEGSESIRVTLLDNSKRRIVTVVIGSEASVEE